MSRRRGAGRPASRGQAAGCGVAFFAVFLLAGLGFSAFFVGPLYRVYASRAWAEVPCEVLESRVETHPGDDNDTYSVAILYRYTVGGREYRSSRYHFFSGSTGGYEGKARIVESLPAGARAVCRVDPANPAEAVFTRRLTPEYLVGLVPLLFVAVGAGGIVMTLAGLRKRRALDAAGRPEWLPEPDVTPAFEVYEGGERTASIGDGSASVVLEARQGPLGKLLGVVFAAVFWNGILSVFLYQLWQGWRSGAPDGCLALFLVPFVLVGVLLLVGVPYQFLALFNPRPRITLTPGRLELGGSSELAWRFAGRAGRIRRLKISLEGTEEADSRSGKSDHTARETFRTVELVDAAEALAIAAGSVRLAIPADTMHTFEAPDNRIVWTLKLHGEIRLWPDVLEELRVVVHPLPLEALR